MRVLVLALGQDLHGEVDVIGGYGRAVPGVSVGLEEQAVAVGIPLVRERDLDGLGVRLARLDRAVARDAVQVVVGVVQSGGAEEGQDGVIRQDFTAQVFDRHLDFDLVALDVFALRVHDFARDVQASIGGSLRIIAVDGNPIPDGLGVDDLAVGRHALGDDVDGIAP